MTDSSPKPETLKVVLAFPYTARDGKSYEPEKTADLPVDEARRVIDTGYGREAEKGSK